MSFAIIPVSEIKIASHFNRSLLSITKTPIGALIVISLILVIIFIVLKKKKRSKREDRLILTDYKILQKESLNNYLRH